MNEDYCTKCGLDLPEGEGRFNFPKGAMCSDCGMVANDYYKQAETLLDKYAKITGYRPRVRF